MATAGSIGKRRADVIQRIQDRCAQMGGGELTIPTYSRHGQDLLLVFQLEAIADYLDSIPVTAPALSRYDSMTNKELDAEIKQRELDKGKARSKPELIAVLQTADKVIENAPTL